MSNPDIAEMNPGDAHFMAYVGPPLQYDLMGATQFSLLTAMGLRSSHKVLDVGCGSLRAGRLLLPYLDAGNYCGIEPNKWLVDEGIKENLGKSVVTTKKPRFAYNDQFDASEFETEFDFVLAQSILSHTGREMSIDALRSMGKVLSPDGVAYVTFCRRERFTSGKAPMPEGWVYPGITLFYDSEVKAMGAEAGLHVARLDWYHPRQVWYAFARSGEALPSAKARRLKGDMVSWPPLDPPILRARQYAWRVRRELKRRLGVGRAAGQSR